MKAYVCGFLFDPENLHVVLIRKTKPEWQMGLLNGVGGAVEYPESPLKAMIREFKEETGVDISTWKQFIRLNDRAWYVDFFKAQSPDFRLVKSMTEEEVLIVSINELSKYNTIPNIRWLIPMCLDPNHHDGILHTKKVFLDDNRTRHI